LRCRDFIHEVFPMQTRWSNGVTKLLQRNISLSFNKHNPLAAALHHQLFVRPFRHPPGQGIVVNKCFRDAPFDEHGRIKLLHCVVPFIEHDEGDVHAKPFLVINVRKILHFTSSSSCRRHQLRFTAPHGNCTATVRSHLTQSAQTKGENSLQRCF